MPLSGADLGGVAMGGRLHALLAENGVLDVHDDSQAELAYQVRRQIDTA
jgi:hypothetical protein